MFLFKNTNTNTNTFTNAQIFILSTIISAVLLFVYSKNSLIYPMNDYTDENIFFSVTDAMFHGKVLYTDIFEHKGPFLYLVVYSLAHILGNSYFTLYLFECIANALFVFFGTKIILLYDKDASRARIFLYALCQEFCLCTATVFMFGGTVEELFLWMSSFGLYVTLRCLKQEQYYSNKELVLIGLLCGALFWTKFTLLGLYTGLALYVIGWNLAQKQYARLAKTIVLVLGGFSISCIPTMIYGLATNNLYDMVNVYFWGNIWGKHGEMPYMTHLYSLLGIIYKDVLLVVLILCGIQFVTKKEQKNIKLLFAFTFIPTFLAACCLKVFWTYYPMPMLIFIPFGMITCKQIRIRAMGTIFIATAIIMLHMLLSVKIGMYSPIIGNHINPNWLKEHVRVLAKATLSILILYAASKTQNTFKSRNKRSILYACSLATCMLVGIEIRDPYYFTKEPLPQVRFKEAIMQVSNANILVYGTFDFGFFKNSHIYPQVKYFCNLDLVEDERDSEQFRYIRDGIVDFIITPIKPLDSRMKIFNTSYRLMDISPPYYYNGYTKVFYLYKKVINNGEARRE